MRQQKGNKGIDISMIEGPDNGDDVYGIDAAGAGVGENGDETVLLHIERPRVEGERPAGEGNPDVLLRQRGGEESADRERDDLDADWADVELIRPVAEELVGEG